MKKTSAQESTPSPKAKNLSRDINANPGGVFMSMALDMSWKLAIVVVVPIVFGNYLDNHIKGAHQLFLILGFILAFCLTLVVMYTTTQEANLLTKDIKKAKK